MTARVFQTPPVTHASPHKCARTHTHTHIYIHTHTRIVRILYAYMGERVGADWLARAANVCACVSRVRIVRPCARIIYVLTRSHGGEPPPYSAQLFDVLESFDRDQSLVVSSLLGRFLLGERDRERWLLFFSIIEEIFGISIPRRLLRIILRIIFGV